MASCSRMRHSESTEEYSWVCNLVKKDPSHIREQMFDNTKITTAARHTKTAFRILVESTCNKEGLT
jgi:hypothetical protein